MHLRRAVLLLAIVLGIAAIAATLAPLPEDAARERAGSTVPDDGAPVPTTTEPARTPPTGGGTIEIALDVADPPRRPRRVRPGARIVLTVSVPEHGDVTIPALGLIQSAAPSVPATFDVLAPDAGNYQLEFDPIGRPPQTIPAFVVARR